jgi:hypothetical protein
MSDLFLRAAREKLRFPSPSGLLTAEDLFDLPIRSTDARKASLEGVGNELLLKLKAIPEASILDLASANPARTALDLSVEIVRFVITTKQDEAVRAASALARRQEADRLRALISSRKASETPVEDLEKQLAALDS